ncbi:DNA pol primase large sub [Enterospora canceri]|uniref:DNA pol primase large sub n=1 Tax=Enterospora canceri TaxID=1081671 RepID=A0A1Y1S852_9MICR|nr:DNA pol primase large sub [Enterospora canceri]
MKSIRTSRYFEVTFYDRLCLEDTPILSYEVFKNYAIERLRLLRKIENNIKDTSRITNLRHDLMTHFSLRLVAVQASWSMDWLISTETKLFMHRIDKMAPEEFESFYRYRFLVHYVNDTGTVADKRLKKDVTDRVLKGGFYDPDTSLDPIDYEWIHFSKCSRIIGRRLYKMEGGFVPARTQAVKELIATEFANFMRRETERLFHELNGDERLERLHSDIFMQDVTGTSAPTTSLAVESINQAHMPPCILLLYQRLQKEGHLKFNDRNLLTLFLKDLGVPVADAIVYLRGHLPRMKEKELVYNTRHNYGLEGKRANYTCFSCHKMLGLSGDESNVGCPFVNNKAFAGQFVDIEDSDALKSCRKYAALLIDDENIGAVDLTIRSPSEFYKVVERNKKSPE